MIHYHVWFDLKPEVSEDDGLAVVRDFLQALLDEEVARFELLRNKGQPPRSRLPCFHALIEFKDDTQLAGAMRRQAERGIHAGRHGRVIDVVTNFHVEIFESIGSEPVNAAALRAQKI